MMINEMAYLYPAVWLSLLGITGLLIGSFLNVVICRLPQMLATRWKNEAYETLNFPEYAQSRQTYNLCWPPSSCCACNSPLLRRDLLPVLSWCWLKGKSRCCQQSIPTRYPLVELACGVLFIIAGMLWPPGIKLAAGLFFICILLALAVIDAQTLLLPDVLTLPLIWLGLLFNIDGCFVPLQSAVVGAVTGYLALTLLSLIFTVLTGKEALGGGDAKLLAAFGAWLGWEILPQLVTIAALGGLFGAVTLRFIRRQPLNQPVAFGPWLILAGGYFLYLSA